MEYVSELLATSEKMVSDYMVVVSDRDILDMMVREVRGRIAEGWQPLGGVSVTLSESDDYRYVMFAQAMVKYDEATV